MTQPLNTIEPNELGVKKEEQAGKLNELYNQPVVENEIVAVEESAVPIEEESVDSVVEETPLAPEVALDEAVVTPFQVDLPEADVSAEQPDELASVEEVSEVPLVESVTDQALEESNLSKFVPEGPEETLAAEDTTPEQLVDQMITMVEDLAAKIREFKEFKASFEQEHLSTPVEPPMEAPAEEAPPLAPEFPTPDVFPISEPTVPSAPASFVPEEVGEVNVFDEPAPLEEQAEIENVEPQVEESGPTMAA